MVRVCYELSGVEYSDLLGIDELDLNTSFWANVYRIEYQSKVYDTPEQMKQFKRFVLSCLTGYK